MSAIFGIINTDGKRVAECDIIPMNNALALHGLDGYGTWIEGNIGLGHRHMQFTPEDCFEKQPLASPDRNLILVSDARIDNRPELISALNFLPSETKHLPDSVFILKAYQKWGVDCARHLTGLFAFALWNKREQHLYLARSPLSDRYIYYHYTATSFTFSSVPRGLFIVPGIRRELNPKVFADYLVVAPEDPGTSIYRDIFRLQMGYSLIVGRNGISHNRFWQPDAQKELHLKRNEDYIDAFTELFERVIADNIRSISPVGIMLSGGLDSTAVAAVAASQLNKKNKRLSTFTEIPKEGFNGLVPKGRYADESPLVQAMALRYPNIDLNLIRSGNTFFLENITQLFEESGVPFYAAPNKTWYDAIHSEAKRQNVKVLLTGASGNLTISWDGRGLIPGLIKSGRWLKAWRESSNETDSLPLAVQLRNFLSRGILPILPPALWNLVTRIRNQNFRSMSNKKPWESYSPINSLFAESQQMIDRCRDKGFDFLFRPCYDTKKYRFDFFERSETVRSIIPGYKAIYGIETRDPTSDIRLFEFCLSLPERLFVQKGQDRWLIRRAMATRLPQEILVNTQRGLQAADWFEHLQKASHIIENELQQWHPHSLTSIILDKNRLQTIFNRINRPDYLLQSADFLPCFVLQKGLMNGRFLRWLESGL